MAIQTPEQSARTPEERTPERVTIAGWLARAIAVLVFIPLRLLWEVCKLTVRVTINVLGYIFDNLLKPVAELAWHWIARPAWALVKDYLWGLLIQQLLWGMVLTPLGAFLLDFFLRPLKRAVEEWLWRRMLHPALVWLFRRVLEPVGKWIMRWILAPVGKAIALTLLFLAEWLLIRPLYVVFRWIIWPILCVLGAALYFGWKVATAVVGVLVVAPCRFFYRTVLHPILKVFAASWQAVVARPIRWIYLKVVMPMNKAAADIVTTLFGH
ncbi:hypothetical protein AB0N05_26855 [Nocardia sp. NPDC051030]|uniref:hypothetical protein n=1 Tax=Nocardia sp. NPDC051030 TaxID=3155162 RepID=UPI0034152717